MLKSLVTLSCLLLTLALHGQVTFLLEQTPANTPPSDTLFLAGSMNFTFHGISLNNESVTLTTVDSEVAEHQVALRKAWGGILK